MPVGGGGPSAGGRSPRSTPRAQGRGKPRGLLEGVQNSPSECPGPPPQIKQQPFLQPASLLRRVSASSSPQRPPASLHAEADVHLCGRPCSCHCPLEAITAPLCRGCPSQPPGVDGCTHLEPGAAGARLLREETRLSSGRSSHTCFSTSGLLASGLWPPRPPATECPGPRAVPGTCRLLPPLSQARE